MVRYRRVRIRRKYTHDSQGAFHVVNREDLRLEIELLLSVAAYSLLSWRGGATLFCFTWRKCRRYLQLLQMILYSFTDVNLTFIANGNYCESHIKNTKLYT